MDFEKTNKYVDSQFDSWFVPALSDFVRVPNLTPSVDPEYMTNGLWEKAAEVIDTRLNELNLAGMERHVFTKPEGSPPLYCYVIPANKGSTKNLMMYGHLDKQPWGDGWVTDPCDPVIKDGRLYGRGTSDDGYCPFMCLLSLKACQEQGVSHPRVVLCIEAEEESGSPSLMALCELAKDVIKVPEVMICMDAGALDYESMWVTSSLRGVCIMDIEVEHAKTQFHSGVAGGIVPETFSIVRTILDRLDCSKTGKVKVEALNVPCDEAKREEAKEAVKVLGTELYSTLSAVEGAKYMNQENLEEMYLANVWDANMAVPGITGMPETAKAGNSIRPSTKVRISCRLPPTLDAKTGEAALRKEVTRDPPYNCKVTCTTIAAGNGFCVKPYSPAVEEALKECPQFFGNRSVKKYGLGGSIPFLSDLGRKYPDTQVLPLGVLGPNTNAHGPNEMIELDYTKQVTKALAHIIHKFA